MELVSFLNKWLHLISITLVVGGSCFAALVEIPAVRAAGAEALEVVVLIRRKLGITLAVAWVLVLITGFVNMALVSPKVNSEYQMVLGIKIIVALGMFIATMAIGHGPETGMKRYRSHVYPVLALLGILVLGISAHLNLSRITGTGLKSGAAAVQPAQP